MTSRHKIEHIHVVGRFWQWYYDRGVCFGVPLALAFILAGNLNSRDETEIASKFSWESAAEQAKSPLIQASTVARKKCRKPRQVSRQFPLFLVRFTTIPVCETIKGIEIYNFSGTHCLKDSSERKISKEPLISGFVVFAVGVRTLGLPMDNRDMLNSLLCDELLGEILGRLQENCHCKNISLVCRRWLVVQRRVKTSLGLCIPEGTSISCFGSPVRLLLRQYSHISSLYVVSDQLHIDDTLLLDYILDAIGEGCKFLKELRFKVGPVSYHGLQALARGSTQLISMELVGLSSKYFSSLVEFKSLRELSLVLFGCNSEEDFVGSPDIGNLPLEKLCLAGVWAGYQGLGWIWRNCPKLQKLELFSCEGIGDSDSPYFAESLSGLQELHLRRCRTIANGVLIRVAENSKGLRKLVFYDGGSTEGLHHVVRQCKSLEVLDLRLPLDLTNEDLAVIAENCMSLRSLRLHSCWLATGAGIKLLGPNMKFCLEELVLVRCRAIVQEPGTLTTLGQHLKCLKRLDLSDNDHLPVKELGVMLASCKSLLSLRLFRCRGLTDMVVVSIVQRCQLIESIDIRKCDGITAEAVFALVLGCPKLRQLGVEDHKITEAIRKLASRKKICIIKAEIPVYKRTICGLKQLFDDFSSLDPTASLL